MHPSYMLSTFKSPNTCFDENQEFSAPNLFKAPVRDVPKYLLRNHLLGLNLSKLTPPFRSASFKTPSAPLLGTFQAKAGIFGNMYL